MGTIILVTSGKGGTGKTTSVAALSEALALQGKRVLAVDCDIGLRNLDLSLGLEDWSLYDFADVLTGRISAEEAVLPHPEIPGLCFLAAPVGREELDPAAFTDLIRSLSAEYDFVLLDSPAGLGSGFTLAAGPADMAIVVANSDPATLRDGQITVLRLRELGIEEIRLLVNRVRPRYLRRTRSTLDDAIDAVGAQLIGLVYEDEDVPTATDRKRPLMRYGARYAYDAFYRIALRLSGERVYL